MIALGSAAERSTAAICGTVFGRTCLLRVPSTRNRSNERTTSCSSLWYAQRKHSNISVLDGDELIRFLGHCVRVRPHPDHGRMCCNSLIPRERSQRLRERIIALFRSNNDEPESLGAPGPAQPDLARLGPLLSSCLGCQASLSLARQLLLAHHFAVAAQETLADQDRPAHLPATANVPQASEACAGEKAPRNSSQLAAFASSSSDSDGYVHLTSLKSMESPMPNERGTSGSVRCPRKPTGASRHGTECLLYDRVRQRAENSR